MSGHFYERRLEVEPILRGGSTKPADVACSPASSPFISSEFSGAFEQSRVGFPGRFPNLPNILVVCFDRRRIRGGHLGLHARGLRRRPVRAEFGGMRLSMSPFAFCGGRLRFGRAGPEAALSV